LLFYSVEVYGRRVAAAEFRELKNGGECVASGAEKKSIVRASGAEKSIFSQLLTRRKNGASEICLQGEERF
jgi:hypothetical protein